MPECRGQPVWGELDGNPGRRPKNRAVRSKRTRTRLGPEAQGFSAFTQPISLKAVLSLTRRIGGRDSQFEHLP